MENSIQFRKAKREDVVAIVSLLSADKLGQLREDFREPLPSVYYDAFDRIDRDENQELMIIETAEKEVIGTLQLSFLQYLTYKGGLRAQIEAVRVRADQRGKGIGETAFQWAIQRAKHKGAHVLQLTTDKRRPEALKFYEKMGFLASHEGMKLHL